ncbi:MAG: InlB B-repeat-containing protein [Acholeplasmatales bacterium]|nr:InlB B-repeat-containing protein [Acholeplasmatales bacterium]
MKKEKRKFKKFAALGLALTAVAASTGLASCDKDSKAEIIDNVDPSGNNGKDPTPDVKEEKVNVTFIANGKEVLKSEVVKGGHVTKPEDPTKETETALDHRTVYTFEGWYSDEALTNKFDFDAEVSTNQTLYAKFNEARTNIYNVKFVVEGKEVSTAVVEQGGKVTKPEDPTKETKTALDHRTVYTFEGWYSDEALTNKFDFEAGLSANQTLYAKFNEARTNIYNVKFVVEGKEVSTAVVEQGGKVTKPEDPTKETETALDHRTVYTFEGWYSDEALTNKFDFEAGLSANQTLYAKFNEARTNIYNVKFVVNKEEVSSVNVDDGSKVAFPQEPTMSAVSKDGYNYSYKFIGWYSDEELTKLFTAEDSVISNLTLYAKFDETKTEITYQVKFENSNIDDVTVKYNGKVVKPSDPLKDATVSKGMKISHNFVGWFIDKELTKEYDFESSVQSDTVIYAKYEDVEDGIAEGYKETKGSINLKDYPVGKVKTAIKAGVFTINAGCENRARSRKWAKETYENFPYINNYKTIDGADKIADLTAFVNSTKLDAKNGVSVKAPGYGYLAFYVQDGSNKDAVQSVKVTGSNGFSQVYDIPNKAYSCPVVQIDVECEEGVTYTIVKNSGGTVDLYYAEFNCVAPISPEKSISITNATKTKFVLGADIDLNNTLSVCVDYENETQDLLKQKDYTIDTSAVDKMTPGEYDVVISYKDFKTTLKVSIIAPDKIELGFNGIKQGAQTSYGNGTYVNNTVRKIYNVGESLDTTNLTVFAISGTEKFSFDTESQFVSISDVDMSTSGKKTVNVTLKFGDSQISTSYIINVVDKPLQKVNEDGLEYVNIYVDNSYNGVIGDITDATMNESKVSCNTFTSIQDALDFLSLQKDIDGARKNIYIHAGYYKEKLEITLPNVSLIGLGDASKVDDTKNAVVIEYDSLYGDKDEFGFPHTTDSTQTVAVRESAVNCVIDNIVLSNYWNSASRFSERKDSSTCDHRALALLVQSDKFVLKNSQLLGYQDTVEFFKGRQYIVDSYVCGTTDFIFGSNCTAYFKNCEIRSIKNVKATQAGYITAMKGNNTGSSDWVEYGVIFDGCNFTAEEGVEAGKTAIGRCWGSYAAVAVINSQLGEHISVTAYSDKSNGGTRYLNMNAKPTESTVKFREYNNTGKGAIKEAQAGVTILTADEAINYSNLNVIFGDKNGKVTYLESWDPTAKPVVDKKVYYNFNSSSNPTGTNYNYVASLNHTKATIGDLTLDTTNSSSSYEEGKDLYWVNKGTKISFDVKAGTTVTINCYPGYFGYTINGVISNGSTFNKYYKDDSTVELVTTSTTCLLSIVVNPDGKEFDIKPEDLKLSGYKNLFAIGEDFTTDGLKIVEYFDDFSMKEIDLKEVEITSNVNTNVAGEYEVVVKFDGFECKYVVTVEESNPAITKDTTIIFGDNSNIETLAKVDSKDAKLRHNGGCDQFSSGYIKFEVMAGTSVKITAYQGYTSYCVEDVDGVSSEITDKVFTYVASKDTTLTLKPINANNYFTTIEITVPYILRENCNISFGEAGNYENYNILTSGEIKSAGHANEAQIKGELTITLLDGATMTIDAYDNPDYAHYKVSVGDSSTEELNDDYVVTAKGLTTYTISCLDNNYLKSINIMYPINKSVVATFTDSGNYKDVFEISDLQIVQAKSDTVALKGSLSFKVKKGAKVKLGMYSEQYSKYTLSVDGLNHEGDYLFEANEDQIVTLTFNGSCYIKSISITYPVVLEKGNIVTFNSDGNFKEMVDLSNATLGEVKNDTVRFSGEISFNVKAGSKVTLDMYGSTYSPYTMDGVDYTDDTSFEVTEDKTITISSNGCYIKNIIIE